MYRWYVDFHNVAQLCSTCNYVHVLSVRLFGAQNAEDAHPLEEIYNQFAIGMRPCVT